jgi:NAD(P)-dependent dehydrogenase (short-subunit alcohol dehydrogenase family)/3-hydroxymyristoyl/3-hydroxydecanoyl-(acyl carrier protein) dehydratase
VGKVHPVVVKRLLQQAETIEDAIHLLGTLERAGAWSLCLSHFPTDRLCYLEYDGGGLKVQHNPETVLTTNHCLLQPPLAEVPEHSKHRLTRLQQLMAEADRLGVSLEQAQQALRDRFDLGRGRLTTHATMNTIRRVDNQISIVMRPETGELYVTPGPRSGEIVDRYFRLEVKDLWRDGPAAKPGFSETPASRSTSSVKLPKPSESSHNADREARLSEKPGFNPRAGLPAEETRVVQRHVLRMVEAALPADAKPAKFTGPVLLLGANKLSDALRQQLQATGQTVHLLSATGDAVDELNRLWKQQPLPHLFVMTARDDAAAVHAEGWPQRSTAGVQLPFFVCQRWMQLVQEAKLTASATLVGVTALGGDFGFSGHVHGIEGGGVTGLFKGIRREFPELCVKVVDAPWEESADALATAVLAETAHRAGPLEVGSVRGQRSIVRAVPQLVSTQRAGRKTPHGVWVVTGGARGVTAVVARELGRRFGLKLHLLGSTPLPEIDPSWRNLTDAGLKSLKRSISDQARAAGKTPAHAWRDVERALEIDKTLHTFRAEGVSASYHACDVADRAALVKTLDRVRAQDGPIHGIIHGAGLEAACKFDKKKRDSVLATLAVKVDAAMALVELTTQDPLEYFVGFGSTSGRFGGMGQTDYSMASDLLCKLCDWLRTHRSNVTAVGLHWPPWADVGMAARPESKIALQSSNLAFMPPLEGAAHVLDELLTAGLEGELLFLDKPDLIDTDGTMPAAAEKTAYARRAKRVQTAAIVDTIHGLQEGQSLLATANFDPTVDRFLLEHRHHGLPILPAVVGMESLAEAATILAADDRKVVGIRRMGIHQGLRFHTDKPQSARIVAKRTPEGVHGELQADFCDRQGRLVEAHRRQMDAVIELAAWTAHRYVADWRTMKFPEEARVYHGDCFRALQDFALVDGGIWARLVVPPTRLIAGDRPADGWLLPSATIDACLLAADLLVWNTLHVANLPHAFEHIRFARPLRAGESLTLRLWLRGRTERLLLTDFVLVDAAGQVVLQVDGYEVVEVKTGTAPSSVPAAPSFAPPAKGGLGGGPSSPSAQPTGPAPGPAPAPIPRDPAASNGHPHTAAPAPAPARLPTATPVQKALAKAKPTTTHRLVDVTELPLIDAARWTAADRLLAELRFDPTVDPFLTQHKFSGKPLLPAVIGLETMIEAASLAFPEQRLAAARNFQIQTPFKFHNAASQSAQVQVALSGAGAACRLVSGGDAEIVHQTVEIEFASQPALIVAPALDSSPFPCNPMQYPGEKQAQLIHGPLFQCLKALSLLRESGWGKITAAAANNLAGARPGRQWFLPAATLDSCLVACGVDLFILMNCRVEVPHRMDEVRVQRQPEANEACTLRLYFRGSDDRHTTYDMVLYGAKGEPILSVKGYRGIRTTKEANATLWDAEFKLQ